MQRTLLSNLMKASSPTPLRPRLGGHILVDQLLAQGVKHVFCVPGESYLAVLDGLHDASIQVTVCRQEGGAAMMADAHGKLTRSEEHTSELQSLLRTSYAVFCLKKKKIDQN